MKQQLKQHIEKTIALSDREFDFVFSHFDQKSFLKHQFIIQEGNYAHNDYFILKGLVKSSHIGEEGKEHILQFGTESSWVSDPQAYHTHAKATLNIQCLEDTQTYFISFQEKEKLCADLTKMEKFFSKKTSLEQITLQRRILCLISNNAQNRYEDFLRQYPNLIQRIPKTMIASYLGVSRETLSRLSHA
ncbi:Crp/Fnr family transcriptional regulator [Galbibacter sp. PAP.153]|uniref:Crp/Fnr family transcriptional regulator n=1 Tax=Galbibacter sp. PAP.153 TaxID=3104623 RepID=UPI0030087BBC